MLSEGKTLLLFKYVQYLEVFPFPLWYRKHFLKGKVRPISLCCVSSETFNERTELASGILKFQVFLMNQSWTRSLDTSYFLYPFTRIYQYFIPRNRKSHGSRGSLKRRTPLSMLDGSQRPQKRHGNQTFSPRLPKDHGHL